MLGKKSQGPLMSCGCSPGGEHGHETAGNTAESVLTGHHDPPRLSPFGHFFRHAGRWLGFTGLYAAFSVCPFCGQAGCPVGMGIAGSVGAFFTLCLMDWKRLFRYGWDSWTKKTKDDHETLNL